MVKADVVVELQEQPSTTEGARTKVDLMVSRGRPFERSRFQQHLTQEELDEDYLEHWAPELGVSDLLSKALEEAGW